MKLTRINAYGHAVPIFRLDRATGKVFWDPNEVPGLADRIRSEEQQQKLSWLKKEASKSVRR